MAIFQRAAPPTTYLDHYHQAQQAAGLPPDTDTEGLTTVIFCAAIMMTVASMAMNVTFAYMLAYSGLAFVLYGMAYLASDIFKVAAPSLCRFFWLRGNPFFSAVIIVALGVAIALSWVSGTGFLSGTSDQTETQRLHQSDAYQQNVAAQQRLQAEAESIAVSPAAEQAARSELANLQKKRAAVIAANGVYLHENADGTIAPNGQWGRKTKRIIAEEIAPIDAVIAEQQAILDQAEAYRSKLAELSRLQDIQPGRDSAQAVLPVFGALGEWFHIEPAEARVKVFVMTSIALELISGVCWLAWGMMRKPRTITQAELARAQYEQHAHGQLLHNAIRHAIQPVNTMPMNNAFTESPTSDFSGIGKAQVSGEDSKAVEPPKSTECATSDDDPADDADHTQEDESPLLAIPEDGKRAVGGRYPCAQCGDPYTARTTWHKFCEPCRKDRDRSAMKKAKGASHE